MTVEPKLVGSVLAFIIGSFIAYRTYFVTKKQKEFSQAEHIRSLLKEFMLLKASTSEKISLITKSINEKRVFEEPIFSEETPQLIEVIYENSLHKSIDPEISQAASEALNLHKNTINLLNLYRYSLMDFMKAHPHIAGNYEKTIIYVETLSINNHDYGYHEDVVGFYKKLKKDKDYNNQYRLGVAIAESEACKGSNLLAKQILDDLSNPVFLDRVTFSKPIKEGGLNRLRKLVNKSDTESIF